MKRRAKLFIVVVLAALIFGYLLAPSDKKEDVPYVCRKVSENTDEGTIQKLTSGDISLAEAKKLLKCNEAGTAGQIAQKDNNTQIINQIDKAINSSKDEVYYYLGCGGGTALLS